MGARICDPAGVVGTRRCPGVSRVDPGLISVTPPGSPYNEGVKRRRRWFLGLGLALLAACGAFGWLLTSSRLPQLTRDYEVEEGPTYLHPQNTPRYTLYIRAPFKEICDRLDGWREGPGSGSDGSEYWAAVNEGTDEVFMVYPGRVTLVEYPSARNEKVEPATKTDWCTLVYRPGRGPSFLEGISRWFK